MTDLEIAKARLYVHKLCLCKNGKVITSDARGIAPMMDLIADGKDLNGYSAADVVVGKAVAMLFVKCGVRAVYAKTLSDSAKDFLVNHGVALEYDTLTPKIINRAGTDICPMEKTVLDCSDVEEAYGLLKIKLASMRNR